MKSPYASRLPAGGGICSSSPKPFRSSPLGLEPQANPDIRLKKISQQKSERWKIDHDEAIGHHLRGCINSEAV
ncbi:hypothetical protein ABES02_28560 [Neobacillus pocheonensis]|uniref:hypothetical protein n=1 Tax=Neobacillus pocheonensis TaxID=363869 RepID=UPI003D268283